MARNDDIPRQYVDCVMRLDHSGHYYGKCSHCTALTEMFCATKKYCKFYASRETHYRRRSDGFIMEYEGGIK